LTAVGCASARPQADLCAHLAGAGESSDALDPVHEGSAVLHLERTSIRFSIAAAGLEKVVAVHIHHGPAGGNGPMLWELHPGYAGDSLRATASEIPPGIVALIRADPAGYYVKLHTVKFPGGAIRGQLGPCPARSAAVGRE
jgi:hypothetical protein